MVMEGEGIKQQASGNSRSGDFEKIMGLLFAAVDLADEAVVEELRGFGGFRFRYRFGERVQIP